MVNKRGVGAVLDGVVDVLDHFGGVVVASVEPAAGLLERVEVGVPHVFEGNPLFCGREVRRVAFVVSVAVGSGSDADAGVIDALACGATLVECGGVVDLCCGWRVFETTSSRKSDGKGNDDDEQDHGQCDGEDDTSSPPTPAAAATASAVVLFVVFFHPAVLVKLGFVVRGKITSMASSLRPAVITTTLRAVILRWSWTSLSLAFNIDARDAVNIRFFFKRHRW